MSENCKESVSIQHLQINEREISYLFQNQSWLRKWLTGSKGLAIGLKKRAQKSAFVLNFNNVNRAKFNFYDEFFVLFWETIVFFFWREPPRFVSLSDICATSFVLMLLIDFRALILVSVYLEVHLSSHWTESRWSWVRQCRLNQYVVTVDWIDDTYAERSRQRKLAKVPISAGLKAINYSWDASCRAARSKTEESGVDLCDFWG